MSIDSSDLEKELPSVVTYGDMIRRLITNDHRPVQPAIRIGIRRSSLSSIISLFSRKVAVYLIAFDYTPRDNNVIRRVESFKGQSEEDHIVMEPFACTTLSKDRLFVRHNNHYIEVTYDTVQKHLSALQCELLVAYLQNDTQKLNKLNKDARQYAWNQLKFVIVSG